MKTTLSYLILAAITVLPVTAMTKPSADLPALPEARGQELWNQTRTVSGQARSCASCHTSDPRQTGKHIRTGKPIKPMAPSVNPDRFTDPAKSAKWFKRNCKWTMGRECNEQEKADLTRYLKSI